MVEYQKGRCCPELGLTIWSVIISQPWGTILVFPYWINYWSLYLPDACNKNLSFSSFNSSVHLLFLLFRCISGCIPWVQLAWIFVIRENSGIDKIYFYAQYHSTINFQEENPSKSLGSLRILFLSNGVQDCSLIPFYFPSNPLSHVIRFTWNVQHLLIVRILQFLQLRSFNIYKFK
jgi:hypothetical protein